VKFFVSRQGLHFLVRYVNRGSVVYIASQTACLERFSATSMRVYVIASG